MPDQLVRTRAEPIGADIALDGVSAGYGDRTILHDLTLAIPAGRITTVIGPNGCGKSTLLRVIARLLGPTEGTVRLGDADLATIRVRDLARRLAMLPQTPIAPEGMSVGDLASRGRQPHQPWWRQWSRHDEEIAHQAMLDTGVADLADRPLEEISGGQRQRAWLAMALAQQTSTLLLDEPTTHLDLSHAVEVLELVVGLRRATGRTIVTVLHDLSLAARYSDHLVVMKEGRLVAQGAPRDVLTPALLRDTFDLHAHVFDDPVDGLLAVVPARRG